MAGLLFDRFLATPAMADAFSDARLVRGMLAFEAALASAEADEGLVPAAAATRIAVVCAEFVVDGEALADEGARAGSVAIALVRRLTAAVAASRGDGQDGGDSGDSGTAAAGFVHLGATSQDTIDTAMVLATRDALALLDADLARLVAAVRVLARRHAATPMLARTLLQPAQVTSFGFVVLGWLTPLERVRSRLQRAGDDALQLQFGGAVGTLATLGAAGPAVAERLAERLGLACPPLAWHVQRDAWMALACEVGVLCGVLGKIGRDWSLLAQAEVGEIAEPASEGRGGSSAMPNKRNPVAALIALAAATRAPHRVAALLASMPHELARGLGGWQAELAEWPHLFLTAHGALHALADAAEAGLHVDAERMRANIEVQGGAVFAEAAAALLAPRLGKAEAHARLAGWTREAAASRRHLREVVRERVAAGAALSLDPAAVDAAFDVDVAARHAGAIVMRALDAKGRP